MSYDSIKLSMMSNKGAVIIKMYIDDTSFCFINCLLESGAKNINTRIIDLNEIHENAF